MSAEVFSYSNNGVEWFTAYLRDHGRIGTFTFGDENRKYLEVCDSLSLGDDHIFAVLQDIVDSENIQLSRRPGIEDASEALQRIYKEMVSEYADDEMLFVEYCDSDQFVDDWGMSQKEFEKQIQLDINKFGLQDVIEFDGDAVATVYPAFRDCFSHRESSLGPYVVEVEEAKAKQKGRSGKGAGR